MRHLRHSFALITTLLAVLLAPVVANAQTVLITGANSGIGLEFTKQYLARGFNVIATHRRPELPPTLGELSAKYKADAEDAALSLAPMPPRDKLEANA